MDMYTIHNWFFLQVSLVRGHENKLLGSHSEISKDKITNPFGVTFPVTYMSIGDYWTSSYAGESIVLNVDCICSILVLSTVIWSVFYLEMAVNKQLKYVFDLIYVWNCHLYKNEMIVMENRVWIIISARSLK